jgi:hypothetical protein
MELSNLHVLFDRIPIGEDVVRRNCIKQGGVGRWWQQAAQDQVRQGDDV